MYLHTSQGRSSRAPLGTSPSIVSTLSDANAISDAHTHTHTATAWLGLGQRCLNNAN